VKWIALLLLCATVAAQDTLVITPFQKALAPWKAHRETQGHKIAVRAPVPDLRALVRDVHKSSKGKLRFVLLIGDYNQIPCAYKRGVVIAPYERDPNIAHDNNLADLDGDDLPDLAVGRLPADNADEAALMLGKVIEYESNRDFSNWRRRVNVVAGVGGFGKLQDWALEQVATKFLTDSVPAAYELHVTYANPQSAYCPPPEEIMPVTLRRFNEGALIVTYLGHGSRMRLDSMRFKGRRYRIFDDETAYALKADHGAPIAFFVACSTGHFDGAPDCLGEIAVKQPAGPIAVIAASRVSMPYANGVFAKELLDALFQQRKATLGELLVTAKRRMMKPAEGDLGRQFIETLAMGYKWSEKARAEERAEHLFLYNLLGDPTTRIPHPAVAEIECAQEALPGARLTVVGKSSVEGTATVELVEKRRSAAPPRTGDTAAEFREAYERANRRVRFSVEVPARNGTFETELTLPLDAGAYVVRVFVTGPDGAALGARPLVVKKQEAPK